ncbi:hypothetical protein Tco_0523378 [Tanacetum coccineum]
MITTVQSAMKIVIQQHEQAVQKEQEEQAVFTPYWKFPIFDDDDDAVEGSIPNAQVRRGIFRRSLIPFCDNSPPLDVLNDHFEIFSDFNDDCTSSDDDSFENIDYNSRLLVVLGFTFSDHTEETSSDSTTTHSDNSLPEYDSFLFEIEPDQGELTSVVMEDILGEPRVHVPNSSSPSPILVEDSDYLMKEIDLFLDPDDSIPPGIKSDDYDSEGDIFFLEELLSNDSLSLPETESFHLDHYDVLLSPRPPAKPPDDGIFFNFDPDTGVLTAKVVGDISEHYVLMPKLLPTQPTVCPNIDTLLPFSSKNEDQVFNPGILSSNLLFYLGKITSDFSENPMMICGEDIPILDVPYLHFYPP